WILFGRGCDGRHRSPRRAGTVAFVRPNFFKGPLSDASNVEAERSPACYALPMLGRPRGFLTTLYFEGSALMQAMRSVGLVLAILCGVSYSPSLAQRPLRPHPLILARAPAELIDRLRADPFTYFRAINRAWTE